MPAQAGPIYRANRETDGETSVFYNELMQTVSTVNAVRVAKGEQPYGYRFVVTEGLGLPDSFTGKIKNGKYVPTREKLESCAALLGVRPETWDTYVRRYASERLNDPMVVELFRMLSSVEEPADSLILKGVVGFARKVIDESKPSKATALAA